MGKVFIVGAGPGDPDLLTLKAYRLLKIADVVLYDALVCPEILSMTREDCLLVYVGKREGSHSTTQEEINEMLYRFSLSFGIVVRLKGGDPFVFGRGGEEFFYLKERGVKVEVVPGITSVVAAPQSAGIPLTHRGVASSLAVVPGHGGARKEWVKLAHADTLVVLMGVKNRREIARDLLKAGRDPQEPVAFIEKATTPYQRETFTTLGELADDPPPTGTPAVMVVGKVVGLSAGHGGTVLASKEVWWRYLQRSGRKNLTS